MKQAKSGKALKLDEAAVKVGKMEGVESPKRHNTDSLFFAQMTADLVPMMVLNSPQLAANVALDSEREKVTVPILDGPTRTAAPAQLSPT